MHLLYGSTNAFKLNTLHCRTGYYGICMIVCGDRSINGNPIIVETGELHQFFEDITSKPILQVVEDLDAWCVNGLKGISLFTHTLKSI